jgi:hypothetical protein
LLVAGKLGKNEVFHKYASCISSVDVEPTDYAKLNPNPGKGGPVEVHMEFNLDKPDCYKKWGKTEGKEDIEVYLIDEISNRLDKMFRERRYCNYYMRDICNVVHVKATVNVWEDLEDHGIPYRNLILKKILLSEEEGYPSLDSSIKNRYGLTGPSLIADIDREVNKK